MLKQDMWQILAMYLDLNWGLLKWDHLQSQAGETSIGHLFTLFSQRNFRLQIAKVNDDGLQVLQELRLYHPSVDPEDASKSDKATASPPW